MPGEARADIQFAVWRRFQYGRGMGKMSSDPLVSTETEIEVEEDTAAAIERGIRAADDDEMVTADEARERLLTRWNGKYSTQNRP